MGRSEPTTALEADRLFPGILNRLRKFLVKNGLEPRLLTLAGYCGDLSEDAARDLTLSDSVVTHAVVVVGGMVIDVCYKRLGSSYDRPMTYVAPLLYRKWYGITDVSELAELTTAQLTVAYKQEQRKQHKLFKRRSQT